MMKIYSVSFVINDFNLRFIVLRKKLLHYLENSDYFEPRLILELMPPNYLYKERVLLLAKEKRYKEVNPSHHPSS
jgi:hypothetical protein